MTRFRVGTSGWLYRHWRGLFYPPELPQDRWLAFYMQRFGTVELNNSFYRQPKNETWDHWREAARPGFCFAVKANRFITHIKRLSNPAEPLRRFFDGASRLQEHLGPALFQTPPNFQRTPENERRLDAFLELLPASRRCAFEFRHQSWFVDQTFERLRRHGVALCCFDMQGFEVPLLATAAFAYMRFHGPGERYGGSYSSEALQQWAAKLRALAGDLDEAWLYFNNDIDGHAVANAIDLESILT